MSPAAFARFLDLYVFVAGACVGSFLNVVIARVPHGRSVVTPPSSCPRCGQRIRWYDNIPLLSWLWLRARCRSCGQPISARYPLVELLTGVLLFALWREYGASGAALGYAAFTCALVALTYIDLDTWLLPHQITWPLLALGLVSPLWNPRLTWADSAIGAAAGFGFFALIALVGEKLLKKETMGWGDVWLLAAIGAWLGWPALLPVILLSAVQGSVVGIALLLVGRGPAEKARAERLQPPSTGAAPATSSPGAPAPSTGAPAGPPGTGAPASDDDWVPPPHALPYGPFLSLAALEYLLAGAVLFRSFLAVLHKLAP